MAVKYEPDFGPRRVNRWFSDAKYAADIDASHGTTRLLISNPAAASTGAAVAVVPASAAFVSTLATAYEVDATYGRCLTVVGTIGSATAATCAMTLYGLDYMGQPITENITLNGTVVVTSLKAFKWLLSYATGVQTGCVSIGISNTFGLPYRTIAMQAEIVNGAIAPTSGAMSTGAAMSLAQTATTVDPRGVYRPTTGALAPNGSNSYELVLICDTMGMQPSAATATQAFTIFGAQHYGVGP